MAVTGPSWRPTPVRSLPERMSSMRTEPSRDPNAISPTAGLMAATEPATGNSRTGRMVAASRMTVA